MATGEVLGPSHDYPADMICHDHAQPLPRPSQYSDPSPATPKLIAAPQLNSGRYAHSRSWTSPYLLPSQIPSLTLPSMTCTHY